jgi:hypothetical protein
MGWLTDVAGRTTSGMMRTGSGRSGECLGDYWLYARHWDEGFGLNSLGFRSGGQQRACYNTMMISSGITHYPVGLTAP